MVSYRTILTFAIVAFASCEAAAGLIRPEPTADPVERLVLAPQRVVLYDEDPAEPQGKQYVGQVVWSTENVAGADGTTDIAIRANIDIPDRKFKAALTIRRNNDTSLPASHTVEMTFQLPQDFAGGGVSNVPGVLMKSNEQTRGTPLAGLAVKVTDNFFLIGLSNVDAYRGRNIQLLRERTWLDIPLVYADQRRAIVVLEKGAQGEHAFVEAFSAWEPPAGAPSGVRRPPTMNPIPQFAPPATLAKKAEPKPQTPADVINGRGFWDDNLTRPTPQQIEALNGRFMVQITSQRSEAEAQASYRAVRSKFPDVFSSRSASLLRVDLGMKGIYYRAVVGPFGSAEEARNFCNSLRSAGGSCVVQEGTAQSAPITAVAIAPPAKVSTAEAAKPTVRPGSWIIQIGVLESEAEAKSRLSEARERAGAILGRAEPLTEAVASGDKQLYRARFAGFDAKDKAEAVCRTLKRTGIPCFAMKY